MSYQLKVVESKGSKYRIIYVYDNMLEELKEWGDSEFVFTTIVLN